MLNVLDEFSHECLAIRVARKLKAIDVIDVLSDLFILRGIPAPSVSRRPILFQAEMTQSADRVSDPVPPGDARRAGACHQHRFAG
jgi:hypothetical protein